MSTQTIFWIGFFVFIIIMMALDLWVFNRKNHEVKVKEAVIWSIIWISFALIFDVLIYVYIWHTKSIEFLTWYLLEKSLSVDNLFVFIMIFSFFKVKGEHQHKILFWWIIWALIMRGLFIFLWVKAIENFHFLIYIFWGFLVVTWIKMAFEDKHEIDFEEKMLVKLLKKIIPIAKHWKNWEFFLKENWKMLATPLFVALLMIELTDLLFAFDSIPAVLAISKDMFIVYTSNIFAILWLRSLYFALSWVMSSFRYLKYWLAWVLCFVWVKMIIPYKIDTLISLVLIAIMLWISILMSKIIIQKK